MNCLLLQAIYVDVPYRALVFERRMSVKCEVKDVATEIVLYSEALSMQPTLRRCVRFGSILLEDKRWME